MESVTSASPVSATGTALPGGTDQSGGGGMAGGSVGLPVTRDSLCSYKMAKIFKQNKKQIVSLDFDDTGEFCVTASEDESICVYDCKYGKSQKVLFSKKYGIHECRFTHSSTSILHSSTKEDDTIRYLSLHDNQYIRYFKGHRQRVVSLDVSPVDDTFISGALDDTVRLWDLRSPNCQGVTNVSGRPCVAFDPQGLIFAIGLGSASVRLYDLRNFDKGPFAMMPAVNSPPIFHPEYKWSNISFSNNGRDMLVTTMGEKLYVLDSIDGKLKHVLSGFENKAGLSLQATFTPDGNYILGGSQDGRIFAWDGRTGEELGALEAVHSGAVSVVKHNPRYNMLASGCINLAFWIPMKQQ